MNILLTGSQGALGKFIVKSLHNLHKDATVICVDKESSDINLDLRNKSDIKQALHDYCISHVIHCAALWNGFNSDFNILYNNVLITMNLLDELKQLEKFIYISSSAVYGDSDPLESNVLLNPKSSYGLSKLFCEKAVKIHALNYGYKYTIWRPFHIVSPEEEYKERQSHICTDTFHKICHLKENINTEHLDDVRRIGFCWVEDIAECIVEHINDCRTNNEIFNIGTSDYHTVKDVICEIISNINGVSTHCKRGQFSNIYAKIKQSLEWEASTDFNKCIKQFVDYKRKIENE